MRRVLALLVACGCGSVPSFRDAGDATAPDDAPIYFFGDSATNDDAPYNGPDVTLDGGGPFLCHGCSCNGTDHYCYDLWVGAPLDAQPGACPSDGGSSCVPYPSECLSSSTCACLVSHTNCPSAECVLDPSGNGLDLLCILP